MAVTLGSDRGRRAARRGELTGCCDFIGFELVVAAPDGLERVNVETRRMDPTHWAECRATIARILATYQPLAIFCPHESDWNGTHVGTHHLVLDALGTLGSTFRTHVLETEFWAAMQTPNLMVESSAGDLGDLIAALSFHVGEMTRNPYHLSLPAWMQDNVRRGAELVLGQGAGAPAFTFATLYRLRRWEHGGLVHAPTTARALSATDDVASLLCGT